MSEWTIRGILNPVITRLLIYDVNPIDLEDVLAAVEEAPLLNAASLERSWTTAWETKAERYLLPAKEAAARGNDLTASTLFRAAAKCYYAISLVNPSDLREKKRVYFTFAELYRKSESYYATPALPIEVPLRDGVLPGYLHLPNPVKSPSPEICAVVFSGLSSCKEEMHTLARPLVERGIAAFVPDMPGNGMALLKNNVRCRLEVLEDSFFRIIDTLQSHKAVREAVFGSLGLCMGGGYAHRAAVIDPRYRFCATLFMLFITETPIGSTPQWMRQGEWYRQQTGGIPPTQFEQEMKKLTEGSLRCPFLFVHGEHDNWMPIDRAISFYDRASGPKEKLVIDDVPVFSKKQQVMHAMPVGEQLGWVKHYVSDWIGTQASRYKA